MAVKSTALILKVETTEQYRSVLDELETTEQNSNIQA